MSAILKKVTVTFRPDGIEYAVCYEHASVLPTPGSKGRTTTAARMAHKALRAALEGLDGGSCAWGGFGTNMRESTDRIIAERS